MEPDPGELLSRWQLGIMDAADRRDLCQLLQDPRRAAALAAELRFDYAIRDVLRQRAASVRPVQAWWRRPRWLVVAAGLAAVLVLAIGLWPARPTGGPWQVMDGVVRLAGSDTPLTPGTLVADGTAVATGPAQDASLRRADGTTLRIATTTAARIAGNGVELVTGALACAVAPQSGEDRFTITSPQATVTVHGTAFSVAADAGATAVGVDDGVVTVQRRADAAEVRLTRGGGTVVRPSGPLEDLGSARGPDWSDRRPVALVRLWGPMEVNGNPRSYMHAPPGSDITSPAGRAMFTAALADAGAVLGQQLVTAGCQAALIWDIEGHQDSAIMMVGDPSRLAELSPEMEPAADGYFAALTAAGLRTGVLLRPERLERQSDGTWRQQPLVDHAATLAAKAAYAHRRWGCTLFFINTAVLPGNRVAADAVSAIQTAVPGALVICEHPSPSDWGRAGGWVTAPTTTLPEELIRRCPGAIRVVFQPTGAERGTVDPRHDVLMREVGDLLR